MNSFAPFSCGWMMAAVALVAVTAAQAKIVRVVEKSFTVSAAGTVKIETSGGEIRVEPSSETTGVQVVAKQRFETDSESEADALAEDIELTIGQEGNDVVAKAKRRGKTDESWFGGLFKRRGNQAARVDFVVTVPAAFSANVRTSGGNIFIGDLTGEVTANTSGGNVRLGRIGAVNARTSGGNIELKEGLAAVKLDTSGGDIDVGRVVGRAELSTSGGDIEVDEALSDVRAHTSGGDVEVGFASEQLAGASTLGTSGGDVDVRVGSTTRFDLDARTSGGRVEVRGVSIVETEKKKNRVAGSVNGGGPSLKLNSSGGDITVQVR